MDLLRTPGTESDLHLINADRTSWPVYDGSFLAEAVYSLAMLPALIRTTYIMAVSETLGPLLISLKAMFMVGANSALETPPQLPEVNLNARFRF